MAFTWLDSVFGTKPKVEPYRQQDIGKEQGKAVGSNISSFPEISQLGNLYQSYLTDQYRNAGVDITGLGKAGSGAALQEYGLGTSLLAGDLPQSFWDQINRTSAQQAFGGGYAGSSMAGFGKANQTWKELLAQILTGEQLVSGAGNAAQRAAALAQSTEYDPEKMFINPGQTAAFDLQNEILRQQSKQMKYNVNAAPDPQAAGVSNTLISLLGAYLGGGMGGGFGQAGKTSFNAGATGGGSEIGGIFGG